MENLFKVMGSASVGEGGETARLCSEIGLELARSFRVKLDATLEKIDDRDTPVLTLLEIAPA